MTFYEAALEVLRAEQTPLHVQRITELALERKLLSHVGRVPGQIMQARLLAMSRRLPREVVVVDADTFGLAEKGLEHDETAAVASEPRPPEETAPLRPAERTPLTLSEARAVRDAEAKGRFDQEDREARSRSRRRRRRPRNGESNAEALKALVVELGGGPVHAQYVVDALARQETLPEGFPSDLEGVLALAQEVAAAQAEPEGGTVLSLEGEQLTVRELAPSAAAAAAAAAAAPAPAAAAASAPEAPARVRGSADDVVRGLLPVLRGLDAASFEALARTLAERYGIGDLKVAKRSAKGSPLFTGFLPLGVGRLRVALRVLVSGRDLRPDDVDEIRADLEHYSAAAGLMVTCGQVERAARNRAEDMAQKPVVLFDGEKLAQACADKGVGVRVRLQETLELDAGSLKELARS